MITDWMEQGACTTVEPEYFFDDYLESEQIAVEVHKLCGSCPVRLECYNYGVETRSTGIWGGHWLQAGKVVKQREIIISQYFWRDDE